MTLDQRIASLEARKRKLESELGRPDPMATYFPLGAGCGNASGRKKQYEAAGRLIDKASELKQVSAHLEFFVVRKKRVDDGECYENGQPRANSPTRLKTRDLSDEYGEFLRATMPTGTRVELVCNGSITTIDRVGKRAVWTVGCDKDEPWEFFDIRPLNADGSIMTTEQFKTAIRTWRAA